MFKIGETPSESWIIAQVLEKRAADFPNHPIVLWSGKEYTYSYLNKNANRVGKGLQNLGVSNSEKVAVMMKSSPTYIGVWFGIAKIGAVEVPINTAYKGDLLAHIINTAEVTIALIDPEFISVFTKILDKCPKLSLVIVNSSDSDSSFLETHEGVKFQNLDKVVCGTGENLGCKLSADSTACIMFTSGTTGPSKGVIINNAFELSFAVIFNEIVSLKESDVTYNFLPFFHIAGKFIFLGTMFVNGRMLLRPRFSIDNFWKDVREFGVTVTVAVGGICQMLYARAPQKDDINNSIRMIYSVPNPHDVLDEFKDRFGVDFTEGYGSTEANIVVYSRADEMTPLGAAGRAAPYYDVCIVDSNDHLVPPGVSGEIVVRPKFPNTLMQGYFNLPNKSLETFSNLWFHSGDRGIIDKEGYLFFLDRMKDAIRRRGENISSFEVERIIGKHPLVSEVAAIAVPADVGEDEVKIFVVPMDKSTLNAEGLFKYCADEMPYFMVPRFIEFVEQLPRTPTQKVRKVELRDLGITRLTWDSEKAGYRITRNGVKVIEKN